MSPNTPTRAIYSDGTSLPLIQPRALCTVMGLFLLKRTEVVWLMRQYQPKHLIVRNRSSAICAVCSGQISLPCVTTKDTELHSTNVLRATIGSSASQISACMTFRFSASVSRCILHQCLSSCAMNASPDFMQHLQTTL